MLRTTLGHALTAASRLGLPGWVLFVTLGTGCGPEAAASVDAEALTALARARAAAEAHDLAAAEAAYAEVLRLAPLSPGVSLEFGLLLAAQGDGARAEPLLRHALAIAPSDPAPLVALGELLAAKGDAAAAIPVLEAAVEAGARGHSTWRALGDSRALSGDRPAQAAEALLRASEVAPEPALAVLDLLDAARQYVAAGHAPSARMALTAVLALEPGNSTARAELARLR